MPTIILVRHGETNWNREKRIQGHTDSPLTLKGIGQARRYGEAIRPLAKGPVRLFCSPLGRCVETALMLSEAAGLDFSTAIFDPRLREVDTGDYSGRLKADLDPSFLEGVGEDSWFFRCPGGESHADVAARLGAWLAERRTGETVIAVSHGVAGKVLRGLYLGLSAHEAMDGDSPQDALFVLNGGAIKRVGC